MEESKPKDATTADLEAGSGPSEKLPTVPEPSAEQPKRNKYGTQIDMEHSATTAELNAQWQNPPDRIRDRNSLGAKILFYLSLPFRIPFLMIKEGGRDWILIALVILVLGGIIVGIAASQGCFKPGALETRKCNRRARYKSDANLTSAKGLRGWYLLVFLLQTYLYSVLF